MMKVLSLSLLFVSAVKGSSILKYVQNSAYCKGNLTDLELVSASCPDEEYCTWGSVVSVFLQVNAAADLPYQTKLTISPSVPHTTGGTFSSYEYEGLILDSCGTKLMEPARGDAGYSCPDAGIYNYRTNFTMFGNDTAWYANLYGFDVGLVVKVYDATDNYSEYGVCYAELKLKRGKTKESSGADAGWALFGGGVAYLTGVAAARYISRKRKAAIDLEDETQGPTTYFELVVV